MLNCAISEAVKTEARLFSCHDQDLLGYKDMCIRASPIMPSQITANQCLADQKGRTPAGITYPRISKGEIIHRVVDTSSGVADGGVAVA
jgi:hypothetical protein